MPAPEERALKLVKGLTPPAREARLRSLARRPQGSGGRLPDEARRPVPVEDVPLDVVQAVADMLARLDAEPADGPADGPVADGRSGEQVEEPDAVPAAQEATGDRHGTAARTLGAAAAPGASSSTPVPGRRRLAIGLLVALLLAAIAALGFYGHRWYADRALARAHSAAIAAARQETVNFVSVSAASVDRDLQRIAAGATGDFKDEFGRGQSKVRAAVVENKVDSRGTVLRAGLLSGDRGSAVVLVAVDATVKNVKAPDGHLSHYRVQVDLSRDRKSGSWLVSRLQFVG